VSRGVHPHYRATLRAYFGGGLVLDTPGMRELGLWNAGVGVDERVLAQREAQLHPDDPINIQFTSGTTGLPKGATLSHRNVLNNGFFNGRTLRYSEHDRICVPVPFYHCFGCVMGNLAAVTHGACVVIPGEEIKTDGQGEVIGLFLSEEIPRGLSFADTIAAIRAQGGLVYLPHPFDRLHAIPDPPELHRRLGEIDVFEVYNARLLFEGMNDEALRFARKYNLTMGAGSDAHVLQGVGTGLVRLRAFETPEEFLISLRSAEIVRRPKSLLYLQGLKWAAGIRASRRESLRKMSSVNR